MTHQLTPNHKIKTFTLPDGKEITIETGKLAKQADGSVVVKIGNTMLLATMCYSKEAKEGVDFLPLTVDYQEKYAALGRFPGGFFKREARPSEYEILISRLIDRAIRPLFPDDFHADVQIQVTLISGEMETMPDAYAALAASAAIAVSDVPFNGPISEVRVAKVDGALKINPTTTEIAKASLDLIVAGSAKDIVMVEGEAKEVSEEEMLEALALAHEYIKIQCKAQIELSEFVGSTKKIEYSHEKNDLELKKKLFDLLYDKVYAVAKLANPNKHERSDSFKAIIKEYLENLPEDSTEDKSLIKKYYHDIEKEAARNLVLNDRIRLDGRKLDEVRPIWSEVNYLPSAHGSSLFTRGETQSLTTVTLGTKIDEQLLDGAMISGTSKFLLHYNFPAFSTGEVKPNRGLGRREVGHGNLAMRSLKKVMPGGDTDYPYTVRVVSDILESNGSSSMATVCAGSLALMDAGVPISGGVSGIAMGLITDTKTGKYAVLSDILGDEDHLGDMDFKVAGTSKGITACQMDIKVDGLSYEVLKEALYQAKKGRAHILGEMNKTISEPVGDMKPHAPRSESFKVDKEFIGAIIGPGGKIIQEMQRTTGATIQIEEIDGKGVVSVFSSNKESLDAAVRKIKGIVTVPEVGEIYDGVVKSVQPYGAFVEFLPGKDGLLHISEIKWERVENMEGVLEIGEALKVKLVEIDPKTGKFRLSRKALLPKPEGVASAVKE